MISMQFTKLFAVLFLCGNFGGNADDYSHNGNGNGHNGGNGGGNIGNDDNLFDSTSSSDKPDTNVNIFVHDHPDDRELVISMTFKSMLAEKFLSELKSAFNATQNFLSQHGNNSNNSAEFDRFVNPLNSFFGKFQNVTFSSINQIASAFNEGIGYLHRAIRNGWKLYHDAVAHGNFALASEISELLRALHNVLSLGEGLSFFVGISGSIGGGFGASAE